MERKVLNEYYRDYLKKVSKDNIQKYDNQRSDRNINSKKQPQRDEKK